MVVFSFYRFYASIVAGMVGYVLLQHSIAAGAACAAVFRLLWYLCEKCIDYSAVNVRFKRHVYEFKQQLGPYGILMANRAEADRKVKESLAEVFVSDVRKLQKNVEQLQILETLYQAGMTPDAETYQLHDCKLKYALYRLEQQKKKNAA